MYFAQSSEFSFFRICRTIVFVLLSCLAGKQKETVCQVEKNVFLEQPKGLHVGFGTFSTTPGTDLLFYQTDSDLLQIFATTEEGTYTKVRETVLPGKLRSMAVFDFSGDGVSDILFLGDAPRTLHLYTFSTDSVSEVALSAAPLENDATLYFVADPNSFSPVPVVVTQTPDKTVRVQKLVFSPATRSAQLELLFEVPAFEDTPVALLQLDVDCDCVAELVLVGQKSFFVLEHARLYRLAAPDEEPLKILLRDVTLNGVVDAVLVFQNKLVVLKGELDPASCLLKDFSQLPESKVLRVDLSEYRVLAEETRFADVNLEGHPEVVLTVDHLKSGAREVLLLELVADRFSTELVFADKDKHESCKNAGHNHKQLVALQNFPDLRSAAFFDFADRGVPALLLNSETRTELVSCQPPLWNYFVKLRAAKPFGSTDGWKYKPETEKNFAAVSVPGAVFRYKTKDQNNREVVGSHATCPDSSFRALQTPYFFAGLGEDINTIDEVLFGVALRKEGDTRCRQELRGLPNSSYILFPDPVADPNGWLILLSVKTSAYKALLFGSAFACVCLLSALVVFLKYKERQEDLRVDGINTLVLN